MALPPVRLLRPSALKIDADTPCVLEMYVPVAIPHSLDPSLPAPPYHPGNVTGDDLLDPHAMPVLRRLMADIVSHMFGPDHAAAALEAPTQAMPTPGAPKLRLTAEFDASAVADKENDFDLAAGYWKDDRGIEHHASIDAYEEDPLSGEIVILQGFIVSLVRGIRDAKQLLEVNPRALRFNLVVGRAGSEALGDELVFEVSEYTEGFRKLYINKSLSYVMGIGDSTAIPRQKL
ncbi:hypothetical protein C7999DRAFT_33034 [Corynascus novoguineensis]|uniref:Uncharacterized protein n=1 Tax=Corynascus novoguineensis TaxID=1126955 RepID=A0AAN7HI96_9PEZI|nr:hypothetical protein C7999DRAFT_33034 [Corynascus novoguineensis]